MSDTPDLARMRDVAEKATPGPWYQSGSPWFSTGSVVLAGSPDPHVGLSVADTETWEGERAEVQDNNPGLKLADADDDAAFIALANPAAILSLLDERDALSEQVERLTRERDEGKRLNQDEDRKLWFALGDEAKEHAGYILDGIRWMRNELAVVRYRAEALTRENEGLREAVEPFADALAEARDRYPEAGSSYVLQEACSLLSLDDFANAVAAFSPTADEPAKGEV